MGWWLGIGFGGMGCRSFDVRVRCREFTMEVGSFTWAHVAWDWGALGQHGIGAFGVCLAVCICGLGVLGGSCWFVWLGIRVCVWQWHSVTRRFSGVDRGG